MGLSHYVYPGALHTRFHHALGSLHLTTQAIHVLREKGVEITLAEAEAVSIAILLHDIGHGPFSHALEGEFINISHEHLSLAFMEELNMEFKGALDLALKIFKDQYHRKFLHQLVSSQLDMDRMDYLNRDSFFTGVSEGVISYDRIIKMLNVRNDELVVEEKGIFSIEKFILSRKLMYWQVYLHKTSIISEQMLLRLVRLIKKYLQDKTNLFYSEEVAYFLTEHITIDNFQHDRRSIIEKYALIDDVDLYNLIKAFTKSSDFALRYLANGLLNRKLFRIEIQDEEFQKHYINDIRKRIEDHFQLDSDTAEKLVLLGNESNLAYNSQKNEIKILYKDASIKPYSVGMNNIIQNNTIKKYFLCYPKEIK